MVPNTLHCIVSTGHCWMVPNTLHCIVSIDDHCTDNWMKENNHSPADKCLKGPSTVFHMSKTSKMNHFSIHTIIQMSTIMSKWTTFPYVQTNKSFKQAQIHTICSNLKCSNEHTVLMLMSTLMNTTPLMFYLVSLHSLHSWWRVPPGWDALCRSGQSPRCGRGSTWGTWGTGRNVLPLHWWGWFLQCCCSQFACWKGLLSWLREYCLETLHVAGGPVFWYVPLMALSLQFQMRRLGLGFNHLTCPSQDRVVWIPYPIRIWFSGRLINSCHLPDVSLHLLDEYWLSWF